MAKVNVLLPEALLEITHKFIRWIDARTGTRSDVPHNYIYHRKLENIHILTGYHVKRVVIECVLCITTALRTADIPTY